MVQQWWIMVYLKRRAQLARPHLECDHRWCLVTADRHGRLAPAPIQDRVCRGHPGALVLSALANIDQRGERRRSMHSRQFPDFSIALRPPTGIAALSPLKAHSALLFTACSQTRRASRKPISE